ncbi:hypothetical protein F5144DRAFT_369706 [Chaetomium tenue]|uniref:Uncharacterized protein n=1 Tax=Chaetomium tenue TaxID=1854479 RepID=A0ACB7P4W6_9PEZI|nr:hypothetical protein F5144DRAFT_369706 [Chaetomium globosum]
MFSGLEKAAKVLGESSQPPTPLYICSNCKEAYSEVQNAPDACHYHPGTVVINHDNDEAWVDCDPEQIFDDPEMREENPEGFMWTCCDEAFDAVGCKLGFHQQRGVKTPTAAPVLPTDGERENKRARRS